MPLSGIDEKRFSPLFDRQFKFVQCNGNIILFYTTEYEHKTTTKAAGKIFRRARRFVVL